MEDKFECCGSGNCCPGFGVLLCQCDGGVRCFCGDKCNCEPDGECICGCYLDE